MASPEVAQSLTSEKKKMPENLQKGLCHCVYVFVWPLPLFTALLVDCLFLSPLNVVCKKLMLGISCF